MTGSYGWTGKVLHVDLTRGGVSTVATQEYEPERYLGSVGLCTKIFWDMGCPKVDAFDPASPLLIAPGPLTGVPGPFTRAHVCGIAAQSYPHELFTYSGFGGKWPAELKYAGYDGLVVVGKADRPVYLSIEDDHVAICDAKHLKGLDTFETQEVLMRRDPGLSVLCIGPAGENLCRNAVIANETGNTAGQGGFGGLMGSKNLKAIAVRGTGSVRIARPKEYMSLIGSLKEAGEWLEGREDLRAPLAPGQAQSDMVQKYRKKFCGSYGCQYLCMAYYDVPGVGKGAAQCASFWYQSVNKRDAKVVWKGTLDAQKLGINHYDLLGLVWFLDVLHDKDLLVWQDWEEAVMSSPPVLWGGRTSEQEFLDSLMRGMASGKSPFSRGVARALDQLVDAAHHPAAVREIYETHFPAHGYTIHFLGWLGFALHWALDVRDPGGDVDEYHDFSFTGDWMSEGMDPARLYKHYGLPGGETTFAYPSGRGGLKAEYEGIERQTYWTQQSQSVKNSLPVCAFRAIPNMYFRPPNMDFRLFQSRVFSAVTGMDMDVDSLWRAGERIYNLRRAVMVRREGRWRELDTFHDVIFDTDWEEPVGNMHGDVAVARIDRREFEALKDRYYALAGWDVETGRPTRACLERLDMVDVADELDREGLLK